MFDPLIISFGLGVGILIGLTGIGGGSLMTPLLIIVAGVQPVVAIGTDLAYGAITKTLGAWKHLRSGTVDLGVSKWLMVGSAPGTLAGVLIVNELHANFGKGFDDPLLAVVGSALLVVAVTVLTRALFMPRLVAREQESYEFTPRAKRGAAGLGFVLGLMLGGTSVGSGALIGLAMLLVFRLTPHRVVGTSVFHAAMLLWIAGIAHWFSGNVNFSLMANILIGSLPGVWIGTLLLPRTPAAALRPALGLVLLGSALAVFTKAGVAMPVWVVLGLPLLLGLGAWLLHRARTERLPLPAPERA